MPFFPVPPVGKHDGFSDTVRQLVTNRNYKARRGLRDGSEVGDDGPDVPKRSWFNRFRRKRHR